MVAARMKQDRKTPGVPKCHHTRLFGIEVDVHHSELSDLFLCHFRSFQPNAQLRIENCKKTSGLPGWTNGVGRYSTDMQSTAILPFCTSSSQNRPSDNQQYEPLAIGYTAHPFRGSSVAGARSAQYLAKAHHVSGTALSHALTSVRMSTYW